VKGEGAKRRKKAAAGIENKGIFEDIYLPFSYK
jgi:hypothetical protein